MAQNLPIIKGNTKDIMVGLYKQLQDLDNLPPTNKALMSAVALDAKAGRLLQKMKELPDHSGKIPILDLNFKKLPTTEQTRQNTIRTDPEGILYNLNQLAIKINQYDAEIEKLKMIKAAIIKRKDNLLELLKSMNQSVNPEERAHSQEVKREFRTQMRDINHLSSSIDTQIKRSMGIIYDSTSLFQQISKKMPATEIATMVQLPESVTPRTEL